MRRDSIIYTKEFKNWFGDWENDPDNSSKVVDSKGKPLAVYHGSSKLFDRFDAEKGYNVPAIWHSDKAVIASHWSGTSTVHRRETLFDEFRALKKRVFLMGQDNVPYEKVVKEIDAFAKKHLEMRVKVGSYYMSREDCLKKGYDPKVHEGTTYTVDIIDNMGTEVSWVVKKGNLRELYTRILDKLDTEVIDATSKEDTSRSGFLYKNYLNMRNPLVVDARNKPYYKISFQGKNYNTEELTVYAMEHGYDGVIVKNVYETNYENVKGTDYIVFHANQVKSALDNNGEFSTESDNIYESLESNKAEEDNSPIYTEEFKAWFGDWENDPKHSSQVVDSEGHPKIVYHGVKPIYNMYGELTGHPNFSSFDIRRSSDIGTHFSSSKETASYFSKDEYGQEVIHPVYLNIRDLHRVSDWFSNVGDTATEIFEHPLQELKTEGLIDAADVKKIQALAADVDNSGKLSDRKLRNIWGELNRIVTSKNPESGLVYENIWEGGGDSYVAFNPNQIKSAVKNNGKFSKYSSNIYEGRRSDVIYSKAFKRWFGDWEYDPDNASKALDSQGNPRVLYHGTTADFDTFDVSEGRPAADVQGIYLTPDYEEAAGYGDNVRAFYVDIKNPADGDTAYEVWHKYYAKGDYEAGIKARKELESLGYDGIIRIDEPYSEYVAFYPNQVKSAEENNGDFSSMSDNIYESTDVMDMDMDEVLELVDKPVIYSDKFKKWFGDWENDPEHSSKMIGMSGRPKVFYHGTDKDFSVFSKDAIGSNTGELGWYGKGFYFASDYLQAGHYGKNILEVYLNIRNPFYIDAEHLMRYRDDLGLTEEELRNSDPARFLKNNRLSMKLSDLLEKDGYDGIVYSEDGVSFSEVIAFHPNQIKSAEDNKEYTPESENIYEASEDRAIYTWEFKRWFGDWEGDPEHSSKMVDKEGKPLVCFHGSHEKFDTFEMKYHWNDEGYFGKGYYFTFNDNVEGAEAEARYYGPNIYKCYLNVRNPFDFSQLYMTEDGERHDVALALYNLYKMFPEMASKVEVTHDGKEISLKQYAELFEDIKSRMYLDQMVDGKYVWRLKLDHEPQNEFEEDTYGWTQYDTEDEAIKRKMDELQMFLIHKENIYLYQFPYYITQDSALFSELVRKKGYDGVIQSKYGDEVLVFESEQIKSVDNKGSFDPESKNIYERIIRKDGKWMVTDHTGKMNLGTYDTKEEAEERLKQVEAFKHMSEHFISGIADLLDF